MKFIERGGFVTELGGAEKAKFNKLMQDEVMPAMADMFDERIRWSRPSNMLPTSLHSPLKTTRQALC